MVGVAIRPPWGDAEVVRSEQPGKHIGQMGTLSGDRSVGKPKPNNTGGAAAQAIQCDLRFDATHRPHVETPSGCRGVGRLTIGDGHNHHFEGDALHVLKESSGPENLVIGMRRHHDETTNSRQPERLQLLQLSHSEPDTLGCSGVPVIDD